MQATENLAPHIQDIARALNNKMDPSAIEDELRRYLEYGVALAQAKRDIVRMHGGTLTAGTKKVSELQAEDKGVELEVRILTVNPKEITVKGAPKQIFYGFLADETGKASYTMWKDLNLQKGAAYVIKNAYIKKGFREGIEVSLGDYTTATPSTKNIIAKDEGFGGSPTPSGEYGGARAAQVCTVKELRDGMGSVTMKARVLDAREKTITTANGQKTLIEGELADETGRVPYSAWEPEKLPAEFKANAVVTIKGAYVRAFRGVPQLNFGQYATVELVSDDLPAADELRTAKPYNLGELEAAGGGQGVLVEGTILEVKKGSGLIFRCVQDGCNRVLQKMECRLHGKQKGAPDLRIKAVVDDGFGAATFFANREATERILGKNLDECQNLAREAMTVDVIQDELTLKLTARRVVLTGNATSDEFGLQVIASAVDFAPARDVTTEAEKLLGELVELSEVSP